VEDAGGRRRPAGIRPLSMPGGSTVPSLELIELLKTDLLAPVPAIFSG